MKTSVNRFSRRGLVQGGFYRSEEIRVFLCEYTEWEDGWELASYRKENGPFMSNMDE